MRAGASEVVASPAVPQITFDKGQTRHTDGRTVA